MTKENNVPCAGEGCSLCADEKRIFGTDPGTLLDEEGRKQVLEGSELVLWFIIDSVGGFIWHMNHEIGHGRIERTEGISKDLVEAQYELEHAVLQTARFGVEISAPENGAHVERTESYDKWYKWWSTYVKETLSREEFDELDRKLSAGEDISACRPEGDWR